MWRVSKNVSIILITGLLGMTQAGFAQQGTIDSLLQLVKESAQDSTKVNVFNALSIEYLEQDSLPASAAYSDSAIALASKTGFLKGQAYALKSKGLVNYYQGKYLEVFDSWTQSLTLFESIGDTLGIANMASNLGVIYYDQGSHDNALTYYFQSLGMSEKLKDPRRITTALVNIGGVYSQMHDYDKALEYYQKVGRYLPDIDDPLIRSTYLMGLGEVYSLRGNHDEAIKYFTDALEINRKTQDYAHNLTMIGKEEFKRGDTSRAIDYLTQALETARVSDLALDQVQTLLAIGDIYQASDPEKALRAYRDGELLALTMETNEELRDIYKGMSSTFEKKGDFKNAYTYQNKYLELKDLIFNLETDDKIRGLQFDFDLVQKQDQIGLLEKEAEITELRSKRQKYIMYGTTSALGLVFLLALLLVNRYRYVKKTNRIIEDEKNRSDNLLLNILPEETAAELKRNGKVKAKKFDFVTILFTDFKGFTYLSQNLSPEDLVKSVDYYFSRFDAIMEKYNLEKIKTVGDAYMCAGGLPFPSSDHPVRMVRAAFEIAEVVNEVKDSPEQGIVPFEIRIGLNTGTVVAGVVGTKKFAYDIWGDAVNVAARMETMSEPGKINISEYTYEYIKDYFDCEYRGEVFVKNKGQMKMYFVNQATAKTMELGTAAAGRAV
jgi:class 3 adenylate cyclase